MKKVYIVGAKRSAIGSFMGALAPVHPAEFGSQVLKSLLDDLSIDNSKIDEVLVGNILPAGLKQGIARQISIYSGIPATVPAYSVNMACGSGMKAVMNGYANILLGLHNLVVAGGAESMSGAPFLVPGQVRSGVKMGDQTMKDHMIYDALTDAFEGYHMGITAENIVDKHSLTREEQDEFSFNSQAKAIKAVDEGRFKDEIVPVEVKTRRETITFDTDEYPNRRTTLEKLGTLRAAFKKGGSVTAGNASGINDGAAYLMLASEEAVEKYNLTPLVEIVGVDQAGIDPKVMGLAPVDAVKNVLNRTNLTLNDIELLELNEAFAAQSIGVVKELSEDLNIPYNSIIERTNVNGGAIALGHPVGASGNRITTTLIHEMIKRKSTYGLASLCIGGGMGTAVVLKRIGE
mgnify:CR=1 FL=1